MRSIQRRFNSFQIKNREFSSFINFTKAIKGQKFSKDMIRRWFNKLVEKEDYDKHSKNRLIKHLVNLSKRTVEHEILSKNALPSTD